MKPRFFVLLGCVSCILFLADAACAQSAMHQPKTEAGVKQVEEMWLHARDLSTLDQILAPEWADTNTEGAHHTRAEMMKFWRTHKAPAPPKHPSQFDALEIHIYGDVAIATGGVENFNDSGAVAQRTRFTDVFVYRNGRWQAVASQEGLVPTTKSGATH
ncbi:MAG TPA: nuclear transport factor 2 family protein [Candidatus Acidoferrales bacterium]|nr:nuclear transport factor 2 family protein [Candidatus Acidoferrales bacterium]